MKKISYRKALEELEKILAEMEAGELDVDVVSEKVKRAGELVRFCREKLRIAEDESEMILKEIHENKKG